MSLLDKLQRWFQEEPHAPPRPPVTSDAEGQVWGALAGVVDPELGIDIVSMGLIREVVTNGEQVSVTMTLSTEGCPVGPMIVGEVEAALRGVGYAPSVALTFDPPWTPADMTPGAAASIRR